MGFNSKLVDEWVQFWNDFKLEKVPMLFLTDDRVTYFSSEYEGLIKGYDNLVKHHEGFGFVEGGKVTGSKLWLEDVEIEEFDGTVLVKADWLFLRKNTETPQKGPVTMVYIKDDGEYKIAHCHFSNY